MSIMDDLTRDSQASFRDEKKRFAAFLHNTNQKEAAMKAIVEGLQSNSPIVWARLCNLPNPFQILYAGVGSGAIEIPLMKILMSHRQRGKLEVYCEDPSPEMKEEFVAEASKQ